MSDSTVSQNLVFISYSRRDIEIVKILAQDLEGINNQVWYDQTLLGGQNWWDLILENIRKSNIFLFVLSPDSLESEACLEEVNYASKLNKTILPVLVSDNVNISLLPGVLNKIQYLDYQQQDKTSLKSLFKAIQGLPRNTELPDPLPIPPPVPVSYLSLLKEKITAKHLSFEEQATIIVDIKTRLSQSRFADEIDDIYVLLNSLRKRDDLFAKVADEIDSILKTKKAFFSEDLSQKNAEQQFFKNTSTEFYSTDNQSNDGKSNQQEGFSNKTSNNKPNEILENSTQHSFEKMKLEYVGFFPRLGAHIVDMFFLVTVTFPFSFTIFGGQSFSGEINPPQIVFDFIFQSVLIVFFWTYKQATPGKIAIKTKIVDAKTGNKPNIGQWVIRYFSYAISFIFIGLGFIWIALDDKKQGWHDKLAGTVVVYVNNFTK